MVGEKIIYRKCEHCKKLENLCHTPNRMFKIMEGKKNKKIVCLVCGSKTFVKKDSNPK